MKAIAVVVGALAALAMAGAVAADGEAGLVIHWGDGTVSTHCIGFDGDDISGDALLAGAGYDINQFSGLVCGIDAVGCQHTGSFNSCSCECQTGDDDCTYWAFFQQEYGDQWRYSALGVFVSKAEDGGLHAWKWGEGSPASAPAPPATTFEAICGHSPGAVSTVPPSSTRQPVTSVPGAATPASPVATQAPPTGEPSTVGASESTSTPAATQSPQEMSTTTAGTARTPAATTTTNVGPPATGTNSDRNLEALGFVAVALVLSGAVAAALITRSQRGS